MNSDETQIGTFESYQVPASTWAIFSVTASGRSIQELEKNITEWLPNSGHEYGEAVDEGLFFEYKNRAIVYALSGKIL